MLFRIVAHVINESQIVAVVFSKTRVGPVSSPLKSVIQIVLNYHLKSACHRHAVVLSTYHFSSALSILSDCCLLIALWNKPGNTQYVMEMTSPISVFYQ